MNLAAFIISLCLHLAIALLVWFWPQPAPLKLDKPPMLISLVDGATGGNRAPSPILGHLGDAGNGPVAPAPPAPQAEVAAPEKVEMRAPELAAPEPLETPPRKPEPIKVPEPRPLPVVEPKPEQKQPEAAKPAQKKPEPKKQEAPKPKPEPKKPEVKPEPKKPEPKKPEAKKTEPKKPAPAKKPDPVAQALQQARKATSRASSGDKGNAVEQALAQARRGASGNRGGGGGEGTGPGGGGLGDVYIGQVMLAVRPNWGFASSGRQALACVVKVNVDMQGNVQRAEVSQSSGNAQFDASAVNAVVRTGNAGQFPPPPNPAYMDLDLVFTLDEMTGR